MLQIGGHYILSKKRVGFDTTFDDGKGSIMKNTFVDSEQWKNMLTDLHLPDDEMLVAESIRYSLVESPDPKKIVEDMVSIEVDPVSGEETVCVDRLELMNTINGCLALTVDLVPEEEMSLDPDVPDAVDIINAIDAHNMVIGICAGMDGGAFAEFLGRLYDMFCR